MDKEIYCTSCALHKKAHAFDEKNRTSSRPKCICCQAKIAKTMASKPTKCYKSHLLPAKIKRSSENFFASL